MSERIRCSVCNYEVATSALPTGVNQCPSCETKLLPFDTSYDCSVTTNWQALRCLIIWAERWASRANDEYMVKLVRNQASHIASQHPEWQEKLPLTFAGELAQLREAFGGDVEQNVVMEDDEGKIP